MNEEVKNNRTDGEDEISNTAQALFRPFWIRNCPSLWPGIREAMVARAPGRPFTRRPAPRPSVVSFPAWPWAAAAALVIIVSAGLVLIGLRPFNDKLRTRSGLARAESDIGSRVEILSSALGGSPAKTFLFQTPETSYIWLAPLRKPEGKK
jgi:hypothetical protein